MTRDVGIGVFLPTFSTRDRRTGKEIGEFAETAESLGFDSLWATDHLLHGSLFYRASWLDPLVALTYASARTSRVDLGTSILVMPTRHPLTLAKEIATLQSLCGDRFILGAGTGWDPQEFEAMGIIKSERGKRTDESIEIVRRLLTGETVTFEGDHYRIHDIEIEPAAARVMRLWVGGGRQLVHEKSPERSVMAPKVLQRIARADGWIARPTSTAAQISEDLSDIRDHLELKGRDVESLVVAHENFLHLVDVDDPEKAREQQKHAFSQVMGDQRPFEYLDEVYLTGTIQEVQDKLKKRIEAGVRYLMLHTLTPEPEQLTAWREHIFPLLGPTSSG